MEQNGGSNAQLFHDRTRSRDAAAGAGTSRHGGCASHAGDLIEATSALALTSIPTTGKPVGAGLAKHTSWRVAGAASRPTAGRKLIESFGPRPQILDIPIRNASLRLERGSTTIPDHELLVRDQRMHA